MKKTAIHIILGWILIMGMSDFQAQAFPSNPAKPAGINPGFDEMDRFYETKEHIFKRQWNRAQKKLEAYLEDFPKGKLRDEALYWLAQSLNMLSKQEEKENEIIRLKEKAVQKANILIQQFPDSLWRDDALALRVEIAGELVLSGQDEYKFYIKEAVETQQQSLQEIKLLALQSLTELDENYVLPIYKKLLEKDPDPAVRKKIVSLLGRFFPGPGLSLIEKTAESDKDRDVRREAESWLERARMRRIPVRLKFSLFEGYLNEEIQYSNFPNHTLKTAGLKASDFDPAGKILPALNRILRGLISGGISVSKLTMPAAGTLPIYGGPWFSGEVTMTHRAGAYRVWIKPESLKLSKNRITGEVEFRNRENSKKHTSSFELEKDDVHAIAVRSGDALTVLILEYMQLEQARAEVLSSEEETPDLQESRLTRYGKLETSAVFSLESGLKIHTARKSFSINEFEQNLVNFQQGKAVINSGSSTQNSGRPWTLLGDIFWLKKQKSLIGFGAYLIGPDHKIKAEGLISIPVNHPASYRVLQGKIPQEKKLLLPREERRTRSYYSSITNNVQGWTVYTVLQSAPSLTNSDKWDFSLSQAEITLDGTDWILTGQILLLRKKEIFIARRAALINSNGDVIYGDELVVPTASPEDYRIIRK